MFLHKFYTAQNSSFLVRYRGIGGTDGCLSERLYLGEQLPRDMKSTLAGADCRHTPHCELAISLALKRLDLCRAFFGQIRPNPPGAFALLEPDNRPGSSVSAAAEMQNQVLACAFCVCEVIKIDNSAIRHAHKIHAQH